MVNSSNSNTSEILKAIQHFLIHDCDKERFAEQLSKSGYTDVKKSRIFVRTTKLIEEIKNAEINYFLISVQHPSIKFNESRYLMTWCSKVVLDRYSEMCRKVGKRYVDYFENLTVEEKQQLNQDFLSIYSKSIGRLDSFSEACLRYVDSFPGTGAKSGFFNINITNDPTSFSWKDKNNTYEISLNIANKYYEQLCSVTDKNSPNSLLERFFEIFIENYIEDRHALIFDRLRNGNFELIRNGLISGVSSKIHLEEQAGLKKYYKDSKDFLQIKRDEKEIGYKDLERYLGVIQTYAMWVYLTGREANFYFEVDEISNIGIYTYSEGESIKETQEQLSRSIFDYFDFLYKNVFNTGGLKSDPIKLTLLEATLKGESKARSSLHEKLLNGINRNEKLSFSVFTLIISRLREIAKHEGKPLFFNVALGNDEYLRAYFEPLLPKFNNKTNSDKWSINFTHTSNEKELENEIKRICSLILGNYSFLQEDDVWLCFSFNEKNVIELRYLAKIKDKISYSINQLNGFDYIKRFVAISKNLPAVFIAKIYRDKRALIGYKENTRLEHTGKSWILGDYAQTVENPILKAYEKIKGKIEKFGDVKDKVKIIFRTMDSISKEDGVGAMFVILNIKEEDKKKRKEIKKYIADMTEVIEMVEDDWKISNLKDEEYLYKLAIQDGATIIDLSDYKIKGRKFVSNTDAEGKIFDPREFYPTDNNPKNLSLMDLWLLKDSPYRWNEWGKWYEWGARRMTGAALAYQFSGYVEVFIISSDGEVYYLDGKKIYKLDPNKQKFV
jgi:hypothetical protein